VSRVWVVQDDDGGFVGLEPGESFRGYPNPSRTLQFVNEESAISMASFLVNEYGAGFIHLEIEV
jgi:hypothetical protein